MNFFIRIIPIAIVSILLTACGATNSYKKFNPESQAINVIAITEISTPPYAAMDWGNPLGILAAGTITKQSEQYKDSIQKLNPELESTLELALSSSLKSRGIKTQIISLTTDTPYQLSKKFPPVDGVDAYLNVVVEYIGYTTYNAFDRDFKPDIRIKAQLVSAQTNKTLYSETFMYGYHNPFMKATNIDAPKKDYYADFPTLMSDYINSTERLKTGMLKIAQTITTAIKP